VNAGGAIYIKNGSTIDRAGTENYYFMAWNGATFEMENSTLMHCGYENLDNYRYTGLYLECDAEIEYSTIDFGQQGLIAENGTVEVKHSTIAHSSWSNVEGRKTTITLDQCTINATSNKDNVKFYDSCTVTVTSCFISNADENNLVLESDITATIKGSEIWGAKYNGIWADDNCDLTILNNVIHNNTRSGLWINDSVVVCNWNTIKDNGIPETGAPYWDESGHGFAGFNGDVTFLNNYVEFNYGHNFETTNCTAVFENNTFYPSKMKCNVEFFVESQVIARNNFIDGAGHNCFWVRDGVVATIENNIIKNSPHNGIWAGNDCTLIIRDNVIENCAESGIYCYNSTLTIENNDIRNCSWWGINTEGCTVIQSGNTFTNTAYGQIELENYIKIKAKDSAGAVLDGASVTIKDSSGSQVWTGTTDANGTTPYIALANYRVDNSGITTNPTYTVDAEKGDINATMALSPTQGETTTLSLQTPDDGDGEDEDEADNTMIIVAVVVIVIILVVVLLVVMRKKKK
jgi:hypothetical protein